MADRAHLELAIVNLLENASKYAPHPKIIVSAGKENDLIFISIKDNGIGIDKNTTKNCSRNSIAFPPEMFTMLKALDWG